VFSSSEERKINVCFVPFSGTAKLLQLSLI